ncbi:MAG TPA: dienelactone hydrolase family protein [Stellaceae bacterium]|nr:dienelactone hydrolase family protein [Stellaceae bacterium]
MALPITTNQVSLTVGDSVMAVSVAAPSDNDQHPAVLVCHHREGVDDFTRYVLIRLAEIGLVAAAPNFYHRRPAGEDPVASMKYLDDGELIADMAASLATLRAMPSVRQDRIATVGHCLGGRTSFLGLVHHPGFAAAVLLYHGNIFEARGGTAPAPFDLTGNVHCPVLGLFGTDDVNPSPDHVARLDREFARLGVRHEFHSYNAAGHAFQDFHNAKLYRQPAADDAWAKLLSFLQRELL